MAAIVKYEVTWEPEPLDPMYGHERILAEYDDINEAIEAGKQYNESYENVAVTALVYANEKNYKMRFRYDTTMVWHKDMEDWNIERAKKWIKKTAALFDR